MGTRDDLFSAVAGGDVERLRALLDDDPALIAAVDDYGFSALHQAAWTGEPKAAELLLARGADPRGVAHDGTALHPINSAAAGGHPAVVHLLLDRGADVDDAQPGGFTPLHVAAARNDAAMVGLLFRRALI
ncbi:MAG: ankyrin repeat domain-containing protein [Actinobacteria bacterium]|nr:ankyrin repeat domain-containing protein [Actinomycetota bacterium]